MKDKAARPCAICGTEVSDATSEYFPFCSERCQQIDLGRWAKGDYRIPASTPPSAEDLQQYTENNE